MEEGNESGYETWDLLTNEYYHAENVWAEFDGNIRVKDEFSYLSTLAGTITLDDRVYQIQVKPYSLSEPVYYFEYESGIPGSPGYTLMKNFFCYVEVKIEKNRYMGTLRSRHTVLWVLGAWYESSSSELHFDGLVDKKWVMCTLEGLWPEIR